MSIHDLPLFSQGLSQPTETEQEPPKVHIPAPAPPKPKPATYVAPVIRPTFDDESLQNLLNDEQYRAVVADGGPMLILAGAGSGKTRVITYRIARLIAGGVPPWRIMALTFTNKAAGEMKERAGLLLGGGRLDLWLSTFHSACLRILRRDADRIGYPKDFTVLDAADQARLIKTCIKELHLHENKDVQPKMVASIISNYKNRMMGPDEAAAEQKNDRLQEALSVFRLYTRKLNAAKSMDFDDLLGKTVMLLRTHQDIRERYQERFLHLMVDEFQDTNQTQYALVTLLTGPQKNICVVGDDDQSIYRWRGADVTNFSRFRHNFPGATTYKLERNYRSSGFILKAANAVVSGNPDRTPKTLWTDNHDGEKICIYTAHDDLDEARFVVDSIRRLCSSGHKLNDFAIFYRTNSQSRALEDRLRNEGFPYQIFGGLKFYARAEVKDILAYFQAAINPDNEVALLRVINTPPRGIGDTTVARLRAATPGNVSMLTTLDDIDSIADINAGTRKKLALFRELMKSLRLIIEEKSVADAITEALTLTGYLDWLDKDKTGVGESRKENLDELVNAAEEFASMSDDASLSAFLDQAALVADQDNLDETTGTVKMMTIHVSKGLEFPIVFVTGLEDNLFPHARSKGDPLQMQEERRLLYVAMTRAGERLYLTHAEERRIFGVSQNSYPSPFLRDLPEEILVREGSAERPVYDDDLLPTKSHKKWSGSAPKKQKTPTSIFVSKRKSTIASKAEPRADGLAVGRKVEHPQFQIGVIRNIEGNGDKSRITVYFPRFGEKKLVKKFAKLTLVK